MMLSRLKATVNSLLLDLGDRVSSTRSPGAATPPVGEFVKGINLGGDAVTIEGYRWQSYAEALQDGLITPAATAISTDLKPCLPLPPDDGPKMLNSLICNPQTLEIIQPMPNGAYEIYLWIMENYKTDWHSLSVQIGGVEVAQTIGKLPFRSWARYGAYRTEVTTDRLHLVISTGTPQVDAHLMGLSIFRPVS